MSDKGVCKHFMPITSDPPCTACTIASLRAQLATLTTERDTLREEVQIEKTKRHNGDPSIPMTSYDYGYEQGVADTSAKYAKAVKSLKRVASLGKVCSNFDVCEHVGCSDSCMAKLIADETLRDLGES